jgi:hypothetical protein
MCFPKGSAHVPGRRSVYRRHVRHAPRRGHIANGRLSNGHAPEYSGRGSFGQSGAPGPDPATTHPSTTRPPQRTLLPQALEQLDLAGVIGVVRGDTKDELPGGPAAAARRYLTE